MGSALSAAGLTQLPPWGQGCRLGTRLNTVPAFPCACLRYVHRRLSFVG